MNTIQYSNTPQEKSQKKLLTTLKKGELNHGNTKNIGKNTIGDNNKMSVSLHDYNMSTHDLSTIVRNTQSPGTLVPNLCLVAQKGDTFDIDIDSNVLTHPTTGPLFGSFKLEHHIYTGPVRLYNSWLHNNQTKIGLNMSK